VSLPNLRDEANEVAAGVINAASTSAPPAAAPPLKSRPLLTTRRSSKNKASIISISVQEPSSQTPQSSGPPFSEDSVRMDSGQSDYPEPIKVQFTALDTNVSKSTHQQSDEDLSPRSLPVRTINLGLSSCLVESMNCSDIDGTAKS